MCVCVRVHITPRFTIWTQTKRMRNRRKKSWITKQNSIEDGFYVIYESDAMQTKGSFYFGMKPALWQLQYNNGKIFTHTFTRVRQVWTLATSDLSQRNPLRRKSNSNILSELNQWCASTRVGLRVKQYLHYFKQAIQYALDTAEPEVKRVMWTWRTKDWQTSEGKKRSNFPALHHNFNFAWGEARKKEKSPNLFPIPHVTKSRPISYKAVSNPETDHDEVVSTWVMRRVKFWESLLHFSVTVTNSLSRAVIKVSFGQMEWVLLEGC